MIGNFRQTVAAAASSVAMLGALSLISAPAARSHHSFPVIFNTSQTAEIVGTVAQLRWVDPHIYVYIEANDGSRWEVESNSVSGMLRRGVTAEMLIPGTAITIAGFPARNGDTRMYSSHLLFADGTEIVLRPGSVPRWSAKNITF